jgi:hypothetical protein
MQVNRRNIIPVIKVTKAVLAQTCTGVFFIRSVSDTTSEMLFLLKPPVNHLANLHRPQFEKHWHRQCMKTVEGKAMESKTYFPHQDVDQSSSTGGSHIMVKWNE